MAKGATFTPAKAPLPELRFISQEQFQDHSMLICRWKGMQMQISHWGLEFDPLEEMAGGRQNLVSADTEDLLPLKVLYGL